MSFGEQMQREFDEDRRRQAEDQALIDGVLARLPEFRAQWEQQAAQFATAMAAAGAKPTRHVIGKTPVTTRWFGLVVGGGEDIVVEAYMWGPAAVILTDGRLRDRSFVRDGLDVPILTGDLQAKVKGVNARRQSSGGFYERAVEFRQDFDDPLICTADGVLVLDVGGAREESSYEIMEAVLIRSLQTALSTKG